jgi:hypothetical protein
MGKKAKRDHTSEQPPLNDDVHWMPLVEAVAVLIKRTISMRLAIPVIEEGMESGKLPNMRCDLTTGERKPPPPGFWQAHCIHYSDEGHVRVYRGDKNDPRRWDLFFPHPEDEPPDHVYFVSRSDFERLWPALQQQAEPEKPSDGRQIARDGDAAPPAMRSAPPAKPGTKPRKDWPTKVGAWLILKAYEDPRQLDNIDALVDGAQDHLLDEIGWAPENSGRVRKQILDFLQLIRR